MRRLARDHRNTTTRSGAFPQPLLECCVRGGDISREMQSGVPALRGIRGRLLGFSSLLVLVIASQLHAADAPAAKKADPSARYVYPDAAGKLVYDRDERGNRVPDFSHCGYRGGDAPIPEAPVAEVVDPREAADGTSPDSPSGFNRPSTAFQNGLSTSTVCAGLCC